MIAVGSLKILAPKFLIYADKALRLASVSACVETKENKTPSMAVKA